MVSGELIGKAREVHGHVCPFLVVGLRVGEVALSKLGVGRPGFTESLREDIIAIVEVNNCMSDGIQIATGCTFGNNSLIYLDTGKNAVTILRRGSRRGVRIYVDSEKIGEKHFPREAVELFRKVRVRGEGSEEDVRRLRELWEEIALRLADIPEEEFTIQEVELTDDLERAPIFESVRCAECGELVMAPKAVYIDGKPYCATCAGREVPAVIGRGIVPTLPTPFKVLRVLGK